VPKRRLSTEPHIPKYQRVLETLTKEIASGKYGAGEKFPSEAALVQQFRTSRITIGRALRELTQRGLVARVPGSGTFVRPAAGKRGQLFGLLIPDLGETEIFDPICQGMAAAPEGRGHGLLWGHTAEASESKALQALSLCDQFVTEKVEGVFFAPLEAESDAARANREIAARLERARIPVVLLDRSIVPWPDRTRHDLVGIDNRRAGYRAAEHLLALGARRLAFVGRARAASTVAARSAGFREALLAHAVPPASHHLHMLDSVDAETVRILRRERIDGVVCGNDRTAGELMHALLDGGVRVPQDIRIVGIDDVEYANLLPVPLTTVHQPCRAIGRAAMMAMLERIANPQMTARDILLDVKLVVRSSCGAGAVATASS
jgi:DNA-binding LacI/PurR family transcriptional regulator